MAVWFEIGVKRGGLNVGRFYYEERGIETHDNLIEITEN